MVEILFYVALLVALANSVLMLTTNSILYKSMLDIYPIVRVALYLTIICLVVIMPWQLGAVARYEVSALPWDVWNQESNRHGIASGVFSVLVNLIFLMWVFLLPGHLYANSISEKRGKRDMYPYIINILMGVILCTPSNPVYIFIVGFLIR